jgi:hypothetical protein
VLYLSGICIRCRRNRTKRDRHTRSKDQDFTHHLALLVVPALFAAGITTQALTGFTRQIPRAARAAKEGAIGATAIAKTLGIRRASGYRVSADSGAM